jgi:hypothetical protein
MRNWSGTFATVARPASYSADPTEDFARLPVAERAAEARRTREAFAARLEEDPNSDPPNWPVEFDGRRLPHGVAVEAWDMVRFPVSGVRHDGPVLEQFARAVVAALAAREEHHRQWLRAAPGWTPWPAHRPAPWDQAMKRAELVAPLVLEREGAVPPPEASRRAA